MANAESKYQKKILDYLNKIGVAYKVSSPTRGVPDIAGVVDGISIWVECKTPADYSKASALQNYQLGRLRNAGALSVVAVTPLDVAKAICVYRASAYVGFRMWMAKPSETYLTGLEPSEQSEVQALVSSFQEATETKGKIDGYAVPKTVTEALQTINESGL